MTTAPATIPRPSLVTGLEHHLFGTWELRRSNIANGNIDLANALSQGWEPFAISDQVVFLRRRVRPRLATIVALTFAAFIAVRLLLVVLISWELTT